MYDPTFSLVGNNWPNKCQLCALSLTCHHPSSTFNGTQFSNVTKKKICECVSLARKKIDRKRREYRRKYE